MKRSLQLLFILFAALIAGTNMSWADEHESNLTFKSACQGSGTADDLVAWTVTSDGEESSFDSAKGIHYGTSSKAVQYIQLSTSEITGTITKVVVNASTASSVTATVSVTVGGETFGGDPQSLTTTATNYTFNGSAEGEIVVLVTKPSSANRALYVKSIVVTYSDGPAVETFTVTYDANGATAGTAPVDNNQYTEGSSFEVLNNTDLAKTGYTFSCWNTEADGSGTAYYPGDEIEVLADITLYAVWNELPSHTATFNVAGTTTTAEFKEQAAIVFPADPADIGGKCFMGWITETIDGTTDTAPAFVTAATMGDADVTYYAVFATKTGSSSTATLTEDEIKENFTASSHAYTDGAVTYEDTADGITWAASYWVDGNSRPWIQLKRDDVAAYIKISGNNISSVQLTISGTQNLSGGLTDITKHSDFNGAVWLEASAEGNHDNETALGTSSSVENNVLTVAPASPVNELYVQLSSAAARVWGVEVTCGNYTYSEYCTTVTSTVTLSPACNDKGRVYGTYSSTSAFVVPADVTVAEVGITDGKLIVEAYAAGDIVPANTGVLVSATAGGDFAFEATTAEGTSVLGDANILRPTGNGITAEEMAAADENCTYYRLTMHEGTQIGFWWGAEAGAAFAVAANKAYIAVPNEAVGSARMQGLWFDNEVTGINALTKTATGNAAVYDLQGRRVYSPAKGIYVVNGKKYVVK